jgi:hypothetical protein
MAETKALDESQRIREDNEFRDDGVDTSCTGARRKSTIEKYLQQTTRMQEAILLWLMTDNWGGVVCGVTAAEVER